MSEIVNLKKEERVACGKICFNVNRTSLFYTLSKISGIVERRNVVDILSCMSIKAQHSSIELMVTDLNILMFASLPANVLVHGEVKISAHIIYDIVKKLPTDSNINFKMDNHGKLSISCKNTKFLIPEIILGDFPLFEKIDYRYDFILMSWDLVDLLTKAKFAMSLDDTRYNLNGICLHTDDLFLYCVATDGHRLSCIKRPKPKGIDDEFSVIIPRKTVVELLKVLCDCNEVGIKLSQRKIKFTCGEYVLISKLIDGTFPDYRSVIPVTRNKYYMTVESVKLADAIDRVSVVIFNKIKSVKFLLQEKLLTLNSNSHDSNNYATESIEVDYNGISMKIGFNSRYLLDILSCIKNKCRFNLLEDSNGAVIIIDEDDPNALYIVMPMRV
ncbi:MAG: DNA polymerase III subunit beta [Wolbachia endosymbiont of Menacanthus eurysternus]|nr:MAG: DNA polymerase III subunit beta [Wolbachia endosymbiont of Menacanthus eurysternus]